MIQDYCLSSLWFADPLVFVADISYFSEISIPTEWYELLHPGLKNKIAFPNNEDFGLNRAFLYFIKNLGTPSIAYLKRNIRETMSPISMVKTIEKRANSGIALYVMPNSYASLLSEDCLVKVIWPKEETDSLSIHIMVREAEFSVALCGIR